MKHSENCNCPECTQSTFDGEKISAALASNIKEPGNSAAVALLETCKEAASMPGKDWLDAQLMLCNAITVFEESQPPCPDGSHNTTLPGSETASGPSPKLKSLNKIDCSINYYPAGVSGYEQESAFNDGVQEVFRVLKQLFNFG